MHCSKQLKLQVMPLRAGQQQLASHEREVCSLRICSFIYAMLAGWLCGLTI